jgi:transposase InsO family protein
VPENALVLEHRGRAEKLDDWRIDYNHLRPHSALANSPPATFAAGAVQNKANTNKTQNRQLRTGKNST